MGSIGYLLDTHTLLWAVSESYKLGVAGKQVMAENEDVYVSAISAYEVTNKHRIGKLHGYEKIAENYLEILAAFGAKELSITSQHTDLAGKLNWQHRDPFDRILAAQAIIEKFMLISNDSVFASLPQINTLW